MPACSCAICGNPSLATNPKHRGTVNKHARMTGDLPCVFRHHPDESPLADALDSSDEEASDADELPPRTDEHSGSARVQQFSKEILELIGSNDVNQTHVLKVLRAVHKYFGRSMEPGVACPATLYSLKKMAGYNPTKAVVLLPLCGKDHPNADGAAVCVECSATLRA